MDNKIRLAVDNAVNYCSTLGMAFHNGMQATKDLLNAYGHNSSNKVVFSYENDETPWVWINEDNLRTECYVTEMYLDDNNKVIAKLTTFDDQNGAHFADKTFVLDDHYELGTDWIEIINALLILKDE